MRRSGLAAVRASTASTIGDLQSAANLPVLHQATPRALRGIPKREGRASRRSFGMSMLIDYSTAR